MKIKMMIGTFGKNEGGCVVPKTPEDPPFEVDSATGNRLIELGVAIAAENAEEPEEDDDLKEDDSLDHIYRLHAFSGALYNSYIHWSLGGAKESPEEMAMALRLVFANT